jgi:hypothetical protein
METETFPKAEVQEAMKGFTCVFVDTDRDPEAKKKYNAEGVPWTSILDKDGKVVHTIEGFKEPAEFVESLKYGLALGNGTAPPEPAETEGDDE